MKERRISHLRRVFGLFLIATALLSLSKISLASAQPTSSDETPAKVDEAVVDATGDVQMPDEAKVTIEESGEQQEEKAAEEETPKEAAEVKEEESVDGSGSVSEVEATPAEETAQEPETATQEEMTARKAEAEAAVEEATNAVLEAEKNAGAGDFAGKIVDSAKSKAMSFIGSAKEITPEKMKKVAAGALGVWGVAAGIGWAMNNLGGNE